MADKLTGDKPTKTEQAPEQGQLSDGQKPDLAKAIYGQPFEFRRSLEQAQSSAGDAMKAFDGEHGSLQLVTKLPADFSSIPEARRREIAGMATELLKPYTNKAEPNNRDADGKVSFGEIGAIMDGIAKRPDLSELEKCRLWSDFRIGIGRLGLPIQDNDEVPKMIDSWHGAKDPGHALITLDDGYHGNRLINMTPEKATQAIIDHENGLDNKDKSLAYQLLWQGAKWLRGVNQGDIEASEGQLKALRALRESGKFADYAKEWKHQFVVPPKP